MRKFLNETSSVLLIMIIGAYFISLVIFLVGIVLVYLGTTGGIEFSFFGQTFKGTNVGIATIFIGAVTLLLLVGRTLTSFDKTLQTSTPEETECHGSFWPNKNDKENLRKMIKSLSENQLSVIEMVEQAEGINIVELSKRLNQPPSIILHRCQSLQDLHLVHMTNKANVFLSNEIKDIFIKENHFSIKSLID